MTYGHAKRISTLLWGGRYRRALELAHEAFVADPKNQLVPWISALYSDFANKESHIRLCDEMKKAVPYAFGPLMCKFHAAIHESRDCPGLDPLPEQKEHLIAAINQMEVLSTVFLRLSHDAEFRRFYRQWSVLLQPLARALLTEADDYTDIFPPGHHTPVFILLLESQLIPEDQRLGGITKLNEAENLAPRMTDLRQKERAYRKIGMLWRRRRRTLRGYKYGLRALFVPHMGWGAKVKSVAALLGARD
jgi:hypothetical protein